MESMPVKRLPSRGATTETPVASVESSVSPILIPTNVKEKTNSPTPNRRRLSLPGRVKRTESLELFPHLKKIKSTPFSFAPLCLIGNTDLRHLHKCSSHSRLPHLHDTRRMSCPETQFHSILLAIKLESSAMTRGRCQSYPLMKADDCCKSGRSTNDSNEATSASCTNLSKLARSDSEGLKNSLPERTLLQQMTEAKLVKIQDLEDKLALPLNLLSSCSSPIEDWDTPLIEDWDKSLLQSISEEDQLHY